MKSVPRKVPPGPLHVPVPHAPPKAPTNADRIAEIEKYGAKMRGFGELKAHLRGEDLSLQERAWAQCYDCNGYGADYVRDKGKEPCPCPECPLWPASQFGGMKV